MPHNIQKDAPSLRLAKALAQAGLCSRREAERWIEAGRVHLNGKKQTSPAVNVTHNDTILVDGKPLPNTQEKALYIYYKPPGVICTANDPQGRKTVFDALPKNLPRLMLVGRLDLNSEGLLLLSTDGGLAGELMHPKNKLERIYKVRFRGEFTPEVQQQLTSGVVVDGMHYQPFKILNHKEGTGTNNWAEISITEGKNREIRRVFEHLGLQVNRLIRTSYSGITLQSMLPGQWRKLSKAEAKPLLELL